MIYLCRLAVMRYVDLLPEEERRYEIRRAPGLVTVDNYNVFSTLCQLTALAKTDAESRPRPPAIQKLGDGQFKILATTAEACKGDFIDTFSEATRAVGSSIEKLLMGLRPPESFPDLYEDLGDVSNGFRFRAHKHPATAKLMEDALMHHVIGSDPLYKRFFDGQGKMIRSAVEELIRDYDEYMEAMLMVVHLGSGLPARATELASLQRINGPSSKRGMFFYNKLVGFMPSHNKTNSLTQKNRSIARFLPAEATRLFLIDQLVIRPFVILASKLTGLNPNSVYDTHIWVKSGEALSAERIRRIIAIGFNRYGKISGSVTFAAYRHVAKFFAEESKVEELMKAAGFCEGGDDEEEDEEIDLISAQMGHSSATGNLVYGISSDELREARKDKLAMFFYVSCLWHRILDIIAPVLQAAPPSRHFQFVQPEPTATPTAARTTARPGPTPLRLVMQAPRPQGSPAPSASSLMSEFAPGTLGTPLSTAVAASPIMAPDVDPFIQAGGVTVPPPAVSAEAPAGNGNVMLGKRTFSLAFNRDMADPLRFNSYESAEMSDVFAGNDESELALESWRRSLKKPDAHWHSSEQQRAAEYMLLGRHDMMVVLPTGFGKTQLALMTILALEPQCPTHVLVAPTRSLIADIEKRAEKADISFCSNLSRFAGEDLILVTPELLGTRAFIQIVNKLEADGRLGRIFVDEIHVLCSDGVWRLSVLGTYSLTRFNARLILLSGTCSPSMQAFISQRVFVESPKPMIISRPCLRPNISIVVKSQRTLTEMDSTITHLLKQVPNVGRAIVYCPSIERTEALSKYLTDRGVPNRFYHGDLESKQKDDLMQKWFDKKFECMVATSAFGVGVDAPNVRLIVDAGLPYTIFDMIQMSGRGGRDGKVADTFILYILDDEIRRRDDMRGAQREQFCQVLDFVGSNVCRMRQVTRYLEERERCCSDRGIKVACDVCRVAAGSTTFISCCFLINLVSTDKLTRVDEDSVHEVPLEPFTTMLPFDEYDGLPSIHPVNGLTFGIPNEAVPLATSTPAHDDYQQNRTARVTEFHPPLSAPIVNHPVEAPRNSASRPSISAIPAGGAKSSMRPAVLAEHSQASPPAVGGSEFENAMRSMQASVPVMIQLGMIYQDIFHLIYFRTSRFTKGTCQADDRSVQGEKVLLPLSGCF